MGEVMSAALNMRSHVVIVLSCPRHVFFTRKSRELPSGHQRTCPKPVR